jgi:hypothetical protein
MDANRLRLSTMVLCASLFLSILIVGFVATTAQARDKVEQETTVATTLGGIMGSVIEGTPATLVAKKDANKHKEKAKKAEKPKVPPPGPVVPPPGPVGPPPDPFDPCGPGQPGYGCWDY